MSTKIYQGFRFTDKGLDAAYKALPAITDTIRPLAEQMSFDWLIGHAVRLHDKATVTGEPFAHGSAYFDAVGAVAEDLTNASKRMGRSPYDFGFSLCLGLTPSRKVIGICYTDRPALWDAFLGMPGISEYMYYNNSDRPENMSLKRWKTREKDWDDVLGYDVPAQRMLTYTVIPDYTLPIPNENTVCNITEYDKRLRSLARDVTMEQCKDIQFDTPSEYLRFIRESTDFAARVEANRVKFDGLLDKDLTLEKLKGQ